MKIYLSSTFEDLREHRAAVQTALMRMGHDVIGMEHYVAEGSTPLERCLADVRSADAYLLIVGWRYGYVPMDQTVNPERRSITELEYQEAVSTRKTILAFLLDPKAAWPPQQMDAFGPNGNQDILRLRGELGTAHLAGIFTTPDSLAGLAAPAVAVQGMSRSLGARALEQEEVAENLMAPFAAGQELYDTTLKAITDMVTGTGTTRALVVNLGGGTTWWSTRLYLLASLLERLTGIRQLVFSHTGGAFAGMASPRSVREGLVAAHPALGEFDVKLRSSDASQDVEREIDRTVSLFRDVLGTTENALKVGVRWHLVLSWLGDRLITRCLTLDADVGPTTAQAQQIIDWPLPDVPVAWRADSDPAPVADPPPGAAHPKWTLIVVDRDAFALQIARDWVQTGLPRARL